MTRLFRVAIFALCAFACGTNHPPGMSVVELSVTLANNCALPLNLAHVDWNLTLEGKFAGGASYTADQLSNSCARGLSLGTITVFVGRYQSTVAGYDENNLQITNMATQSIDVFVGGSPQVNATLFPEPGNVGVHVAFQCCVDPATPSDSGTCGSQLTPGDCATAGAPCTWACADMCCRGEDSACGDQTPTPQACSAAGTGCSWTKCT